MMEDPSAAPGGLRMIPTQSGSLSLVNDFGLNILINDFIHQESDAADVALKDMLWGKVWKKREINIVLAFWTN